MKHFSPILQDLINAFKGLPGIGVKSAQRIVFNLIQHNQEKALFLSDAINLIEGTDIEASRIAYGVPMGGELEYVDSSTLTQALNNRSIVSKR